MANVFTKIFATCHTAHRSLTINECVQNLFIQKIVSLSTFQCSQVVQDTDSYYLTNINFKYIFGERMEILTHAYHNTTLWLICMDYMCLLGVSFIDKKMYNTFMFSLQSWLPWQVFFENSQHCVKYYVSTMGLMSLNFLNWFGHTSKQNQNQLCDLLLVSYIITH